MKRLVIYPTFLCPFACQFCYNKNNNSLNERLTPELLKQKVSELTDDVSEFVISGGEPMSWDKSYFNSIVDVLKLFGKPITVEAYPYSLTNYRDDIEYNFSYDFTIRPRALEAWENLMRLKKPYKLTVTISPLLFKIYPNALLYKFSLLENLKEVEFIPYCKNEISAFDITKNDSLVKFNKILLSNKLNTKFTLKNKTNLISKMLGEYNPQVDICLMPNGDLKYKDFEGEILTFKPLTNDVLKNDTPFKYPENIDLYDENIIKWCQEYGVI